MLKINEVSKLTGITIRTLHYYDEIDLLNPSEFTSSGYRLYTEDDIEILQQILFFKELDFSLSEIKDIITNPSFEKKRALENHKELLIKKRNRLNNLINLVDKTIEGDDNMSFKEFDMSDIEKSKKNYAKEVKDRWGSSDSYKESEKKTNNYGKDDWKIIDEESSNIFKSFAINMDKPVESLEVQKLVKEWQSFITSRFYNCTNEILQCLGQMYTGDERFKKNIDKYGDGLAVFLSQAIEFYCNN